MFGIEAQALVLVPRSGDVVHLVKIDLRRDAQPPPQQRQEEDRHRCAPVGRVLFVGEAGGGDHGSELPVTRGGGNSLARPVCRP